MAMSGFDELPDSLILQIFHAVSDIKTLLLCRAVSKRFNSLVPQIHSLLLKVDRIISLDSNDSRPFAILDSVSSFCKYVCDWLYPDPLQTWGGNATGAPTRFLRGFDRVRDLQIELPSTSNDIQLDETGAVVKWKAQFGKTLNRCVIVGFRTGKKTPSLGGSGLYWLKTRVFWTINSLIAASARHYMVKEIVRERKELEKLVVRDRDGEGVMEMDGHGLKEYREELETKKVDTEPTRLRRTKVPSVRMKMRYEPRMELKCGMTVVDATLIIVSSTAMESGAQFGDTKVDENQEDEDDEMNATLLDLIDFGETYEELVHSLTKRRRYILEMNSF